jgi:hypothetical protein
MEAFAPQKHAALRVNLPAFDSLPRALLQVDTQAGTTSVWRPGFQKFALEPRFVARPGATAEDDGWLLTVMFDSGAASSGARAAGGACACTHLACLLAGTLDCHLVILSAQHLEQGPVAMLKFREARGLLWGLLSR